MTTHCNALLNNQVDHAASAHDLICVSRSFDLYTCQLRSILFLFLLKPSCKQHTLVPCSKEQYALKIESATFNNGKIHPTFSDLTSRVIDFSRCWFCGKIASAYTCSSSCWPLLHHAWHASHVRMRGADRIKVRTIPKGSVNSGAMQSVGTLEPFYSTAATSCK